MSVNEITKPSHYHKGSIDVIDFGNENFVKAEMKGFYRMNALKYVARYDKKDGVKDLVKARDYIKKLIELEDEK